MTDQETRVQELARAESKRLVKEYDDIRVGEDWHLEDVAREVIADAIRTALKEVQLDHESRVGHLNLCIVELQAKLAESKSQLAVAHKALKKIATVSIAVPQIYLVQTAAAALLEMGDKT